MVHLVGMGVPGGVEEEDTGMMAYDGMKDSPSRCRQGLGGMVVWQTSDLGREGGGCFGVSVIVFPLQVYSRVSPCAVLIVQRTPSWVYQLAVFLRKISQESLNKSQSECILMKRDSRKSQDGRSRGCILRNIKSIISQ